MKTLGISTLIAVSALVTNTAVGQTRPASKPASATASKAVAAKPAAATKATPAAAKPAAKPAAVAPAAEPAVQAAPEATAKSATITKAQGAAAHEFGKGSMAANLGVGFGLGYGYSLFTGVRSTPALSLSVERGIIDNLGPGVIGVGGMIGYKAYSWKSGDYKGSWKNFLVSARGAYHYNVFDIPKLDTYAGISLGVRVESYSDNYLDREYTREYGGSYVTSGFFLGGRYMFNDNLGAFGEAGYDMSYLKLGLTARF
ncbi:hypothetical protein [Solirubrum puertoriconensis]|uniref:Outer membrane protein beta-barrel domain-containing protein n=1 Tax=Solirubrum puertoriconensis TaxID=1751427 RepID=A0A9X0HLQ0_SOLP1|nr:hypothetical protein [Solirubrum puertoriconensis]KUG08228.1 hypothetical protein ASU33_08570 [Solirubrum puertoriconensis]